jgi:hypothetical protein
VTVPQTTYLTVARYLSPSRPDPSSTSSLFSQRDGRWIVEHWCRTCGQLVPTAELLTHTEAHASERDPLAFVDH